MGIVGGVIVSGLFQGFDQGYLLKALDVMGPAFCGVTRLPFTATDDEIVHLDQQGVKVLRFNVKRGGSEGGYFKARLFCEKGE